MNRMLNNKVKGLLKDSASYDAYLQEMYLLEWYFHSTVATEPLKMKNIQKGVVQGTAPKR